ncbi:hypothetical protein [Pediococcus acidilactici]|uniref:hypothetical protein n=2 Tax=Lactobacillaceae TaxID=33958 RepID=UPI001325D841|nr:hypothetical protein [Pediococcus acidilactici]KAF0339740.1 hypothetical protein GBO40_04165 [Pediococcus acidilactici]KAF0388345.1 hypothetical protein GBO66_08665 [Pediococcus acidilactici]KAF0452943.1 hypothetical protein GBO98_04210 [Pediococcus acidilactici]KAF0514475.1 hypothetical protein GBP27_06990 [Pediococcus acidilactici]KAF0535026.1 hypothetical protein GBP38_03555 [Pediococcus acidilactici]
MSLRKYTKFNIREDDGSLTIQHKGTDVGNISNPGDSRIISGTAFKIFDCNFYRTFEEQIILNDGSVVDSYKKSENFRLYLSESEHILFVPGATSTIRAFLKDLQTSYPDKIELSLVNFNFNAIRSNESITKGVWFKVQDDIVDSKAFFGDEVDQNDEANNALNNEDATYIISQFDIAGVERTIGFSKKGAIVSYNYIAATPETPLPYLQLSFDVYKQVSSLM